MKIWGVVKKIMHKAIERRTRSIVGVVPENIPCEEPL